MENICILWIYNTQQAQQKALWEEISMPNPSLAVFTQFHPQELIKNKYIFMLK